MRPTFFVLSAYREEDVGENCVVYVGLTFGACRSVAGYLEVSQWTADVDREGHVIWTYRTSGDLSLAPMGGAVDHWVYRVTMLEGEA
jgi:hypothetical protein